MNVNIISTYNFSSHFRQSPKQAGKWKEMQFSIGNDKNSDLLICLNPPNQEIPPLDQNGERWLLTQEPPIKTYKWHQKAFPYFDRIFTQHINSERKNMVNIQTCLPWHISHNYDDLSVLSPGKKTDTISSITSNLYQLEGHKIRWDFLQYLLKTNLSLELYGKGFRFLPDKFDGLYPFKYSIAIENSFFPDYWTEKIADCFLSWTMPIYAGCPNITQYFPPESMIILDLSDFQKSKTIIERAVREKRWEKNMDAIAEARRLILEKYQFFPWIYQMVQNYHSEKELYQTSRERVIPAFSGPSPSFVDRLAAGKKIFNKLFKHGQ